MHQAKMNNLQNHLQHMQQHQQAARRHQMPPPPATGAASRLSASYCLGSRSQQQANHQQPVQHNLQKKAISKVMTPAKNTQQSSAQRQHQHQHRQHQQFQHRRQQADEQTQQQQSSNASPCEILLALQRSVEISKVLEEKVNNLSKTVYSVLMTLMREKFGSPVDNHSKSEDTH
ncbi:putative cyclin-dependent serine/threonine-protein kinase DDB_G0272797/DDB_G0274007 [Drosophila sulfurigaster albostrigata]|uniref:putative cyclin-dependent serine/threonine-protein kinase DDB_G0272797/DDB_G0274007 n=1 Tax=Drosophila sulfurigaster albostrigata TaxID=89887 RepID=UPI002D21D675|nr:putative cyclin-dependent serine/threonine-protein kinase DDB_G0272797/DDB_G0274007 [Drosophila sulfurigaster albostrigata]